MSLNFINQITVHSNSIFQFLTTPFLALSLLIFTERGTWGYRTEQLVIN